MFSRIAALLMGAVILSAVFAIPLVVKYDHEQIVNLKGAIAESKANYYESVVEVTKPKMIASAVNLGGGLFITANHVANDWSPGDFQIEGATSVKRLWVSPETELGMFNVRGLETPAAELDCKTPDAQIGDEIEAIGNPFGLRNVHTYGRIAAITDKYFEVDTERTLQLANAPLLPGMSGGGVFHNGKLIGITSAMIGQGSPLGYIVPKSVICTEIAKTHATPQAPKHGPVVGG